MAFIVGIDGGGTKTAVTVAHGDTEEILLTFTVGPINYNGGDAEAIAASFEEIFNRTKLCCTHLEEVIHVCIGAAGVSNPVVARFLEKQVRDNGYIGPLTITGDQETALYGAQNAMRGIILIAGTGSICFGVNEKGEQHRTGGFGHLIDDEGSGYCIGRDLLSILVQAEDGRMADTIIPALVYERLGLGTVQEVIGFVYHKNTTKKDIAQLAPIMTAACELGDAEALKLAEQCAASLLELVVPVIERLKLYESPIAIAGSVLQKSRFVKEALERKLAQSYPQTKLILPIKNAAYGAVLLGRSKMIND
ncbi:MULTISPECIES: BadF/BadG/BcrA/BcrD ATPase family protein [unclassified Paenibacillus]|uniref:N-acetylglucosamine kinase n=1 Tax=unclassified Paenibacillus TaxID=185978 RepID=UPI0024055338|nr:MULTISPECIES: BadF/BadG/BcrA/BcrD ATPase family protein [unclassified Paenibacillus]MDF9840595.1 N-acetylglucosamine kinase-like BadF-type ATPase [Paenibacillus sp. PastF-2]MDF9847177.1 N-acetylglucosamine kinase-like BadF-type ATPase [Paenibacillus sp. PastM-2]MDF9853749.1 N-acetylglucosamine kinase-like BadF-type ATPase [Paenibacillus sp. PastF-1]MDH6478765.1 N-acetylglucosamine kinase-like BadF-type ATPase [Paenibacillus sp. PastH-2]MDH6506497.1 N-acetylglucosamine kinase-like BadF-type 